MNNPLTKLIERRGEEHRKRQRDIADCLDQRQCESDFKDGANDELITKAIRLDERISALSAYGTCEPHCEEEGDCHTCYEIKESKRKLAALLKEET